MRIIHRLFPLWVTLGLVIPAGIGWLRAAPSRARSPRSSGPASCACSWYTTSRSRSTRSATSDAGASRPRTVHERLLARGPLIRRVLAPQPPRLPRSAMHGLRLEVDLGGVVIRAMKRLGLAWNVVLITPERQQQRMQEPRPALRPTSPQLERVPQREQLVLARRLGVFPSAGCSMTAAATRGRCSSSTPSVARRVWPLRAVLAARPAAASPRRRGPRGRERTRPSRPARGRPSCRRSAAASPRSSGRAASRRCARAAGRWRGARRCRSSPMPSRTGAHRAPPRRRRSAPPRSAARSATGFASGV